MEMEPKQYYPEFLKVIFNIIAIIFNTITIIITVIITMIIIVIVIIIGCLGQTAVREADSEPKKVKIYFFLEIRKSTQKSQTVKDGDII